MSKPSNRSYFYQSLVRIMLIGATVLILLAVTRIGQAGPLQQTGGEEPTPTLTIIEAPTPLPGVPVQFDGENLFYVQEGIYDLTPVERAALIEKRIHNLATNPFVQDVEILLAESELGTELLVGDLSILTVTDTDARTLGMTRQEASQAAAEIIQAAIVRSRQSQSVTTRISRIAAILGILVGLILSYFILHRINLSLNRQIDSVAPLDESKGVIYRTKYYRSGVWKRGVKLVVKIIKWVLYLLLLIIGLPFLLRLFPATVKLAETLLGLLLTPLQLTWTWLTDNLDNFIAIALIALVFYIINWFSVFIFREIEEGNITFSGFDPEWAPFTRRIISFLLLVGAVIVAFPYVPGSDSPAFRGITIFLGALFTLSSTAAVTNIVAGVIQTYTGAFRAGDIVRIGDVTGRVTAKQLITTRILTFKNEEVSIPNGNVLSTNVINYSSLARLNKLVLYTTVTIGYDVPWQKVHELLLAAAQSTSTVMAEPPPYVLQTSLNDFHISYQLNCYTNEPERMYVTYSELHSNIQDQFVAAGVEIMSPAFTAFRDGSASTIPGVKVQGDNPGDLFQKK